jgi:hypothetical protein
MSINGAVTELNKEIERLTKIRDSLLQGASAGTTSGGTAPAATVAKKPGPKPGVKKSISVKKSVKAPAEVGKRVFSAATRKKMSDAAKARAAAKKSTVAK